MSIPKKHYSKEFKEKAIALSYERSNIKELAEELDVDVQGIYKWRKGLGNSSTPRVRNSATPDSGSASEIKRLKKELKDTQLELEILKKAVHIFSKNDGNSINS
jgi:transposase